MKKIAIITARGGSKRIPKKNIKEFCGKPIIAYSIEAALKSSIFDEVMVSTDSEEIAMIAKHYGADVPFMRSEATSNDWAVTADVLKEVLADYTARGKQFDLLCCIYPTAPFITAEKLRQAESLLEHEKADSLMPVVRFNFPPQRGLLIKDNRAGYQYPEFETARSQDLEPIYHDCGQFYACRTEPFLQAGTTDVEKLLPLVLTELEVQDIDTLEDWALAEMKYKLLKA